MKTIEEVFEVLKHIFKKNKKYRLKIKELKLSNKTLKLRISELEDEKNDLLLYCMQK